MTREELIKLVERLMRNDYKTEKEGDRMLNLVEANLPIPISDMIFWPDKERTAEEIVDEALAFRPVALPPPGGPQAG